MHFKNNTHPLIAISALSDLTMKVRPFILRRVKEDVAKDLPQLIICDRRVQMTESQVCVL